jgi:RNA polymerase sigma-70 factor (ECF subfamily)
LTRWRAGDTSAGRSLVQRYYGLIRRFFIYKVALPEDANDLTQETFTAFSRRRDHIHGVDADAQQLAVRRYLFGIAANLLREYIGKRLKRERERIDFHDLCVNTLLSPPSLLHHRQEERLLVHALRALPLEQQIALELNLFEDLSGREIAEILEIPEGTVRGRLRLAKASLDRHIAALAETPAAAHETLTNLAAWATAIRRQLTDDPDAPG